MTASARHRTRSAAGLTFALVASLAGLAGLAPTAQAANTSATSATAVPNKVGHVYVKPGYQQVRVYWQEPVWNGTPVTAYRITLNPGNQVVTVSSAYTTRLFTGLTNNVRYSVRVEAINGNGTGPWNASAGYPRGYDRFTTIPNGNGDLFPDVVAVNAQHVAWRYPGTGTGKIYGGGAILSGLEKYRGLISPRWSATDAHMCDLIGVPFSGVGMCYKLGADNTWRARQLVSDLPYEGYRHVLSPGDVTGDKIPDLYGITDAGDLYLRHGFITFDGSRFGFRKPIRLNGGWQGFNEVSAVGDFNQDGRNDLVARKPDGTMWLYAGNNKGTFNSSTQIGSGWKYAAAITGGNDFDSDGRKDVVAIWSDGSLRNHRGNGSNGFLNNTLMASNSFKAHVGPN